jgi:hypothetical protein
MERGAIGSVILSVPKLLAPRGVVFLLAACAVANAQSALEIVRRSIDHDSTNFERLKDYTYQQRQEEREFDANGNIKKTETETRDVTMLAGRPFQRLIARDDKPLSQRDADRERERAERELNRREHMTPAERAKVEKNRRETRKFLNELPDAFDFHFVGIEQVSGKPAWVIECDPKPGFHPKDTRASILAKIRGKVWIDQAEYQWVKAEMEVVDTLSFGLGLLRVAAGGSISYEQTRVNDEVWVPTRAVIRGDARLAYVKKVRAEIEITYRDYKKFQADSRLVTAQN